MAEETRMKSLPLHPLNLLEAIKKITQTNPWRVFSASIFLQASKPEVFPASTSEFIFHPFMLSGKHSPEIQAKANDNMAK